MIKGFYIRILSQHILKTHEKRINVSVLVLNSLKINAVDRRSYFFEEFIIIRVKKGQ